MSATEKETIKILIEGEVTKILEAYNVSELVLTHMAPMTSMALRKKIMPNMTEEVWRNGTDILDVLTCPKLVIVEATSFLSLLFQDLHISSFWTFLFL